MPMTAAERQRLRRSRIASDPVLHAQKKAKECERWSQRKASGKVKSVKDMTEREHRNAKKYWKAIKAKQRKQQRSSLLELQNLTLTPPATPNQPMAANSGSTRAIRRSVRERNRRKVQKVIASLKDDLAKQRRMTEKYRKRWLRATPKTAPDTPKKMTKWFMRHANTPTLRRKLLFHNVLIAQLKSKYQAVDRHERKKKEFKRLFSGALVRKYRVSKDLKKEIGLHRLRRSCDEANTSSKRKQYKSKSHKYVQKVIEFFSRDDNSRMTAGKKETKTFSKIKKQKRLLTDSVRNLHQKYLFEHPDSRISYTLFTRLRPYWVVAPTERDRQTCLCKVHENFEFLVEKLHSLKVLEFRNCDDLVRELTCDTDSKKCMYGECEICNNPELPITQDANLNETTSWKKWVTKREDREVRGANKSVAFTVKDVVQGSLETLIDEATMQIERYRRHTFNIVNQFRHGRLLRENMTDEEVLIHIDFSENYVCKLNAEIQSMHFGASKKQVTLHTGVFYIGKNSKGNSFCTVSDSLHHGPAAIWAHLEPVLKMIQSEHSISVIHFCSDGPCTQYRQKANFYLFTKKMKELHIKHATWNFSESGHGKGAPDGVGGAVKVRTCC